MTDRLYYYNAVITRVIDGDTVEAEIDMGFSTWRKTMLRLDRINAYEVKLYKGVTEEEKAKGLEAKALLESMLEQTDNKALVHTTYKGKYGRWIAEIWIGDVNVADELLAKGLAVEVDY